MSNHGGVKTNWPEQRLAASLFLVLGTDLFIVSPLLPQMSRDFGMSADETSVVAWSFSVVYACLAPVCALLTHRVTRKTAMWTGMALFSVGSLTAALMPTLPLVVIGRVLAGLGAAVLSPPVWSFASETAAPHEVGRAVAGVATMFAAGQIIGVPLGSQVAALTSWRYAFLAMGCVALILTLLIARRLGPEARIPERAPLLPSLQALFSVWRNPIVLRQIVANFFTQGTRYATYTFAGALLHSRFGLHTAQLGLVGALVGIGSLGGSLIGGRLVDRAHARGSSQPLLNVAYTSILTVAVVTALMAPTLWVALPAWIVTFVAGSAFVSNSQQLVSQATGAHRAYALSWNNTAMYAAMASCTLLLGTLGIGTTAFVMGAGALGLLAIASSTLLWRYTTTHHPPSS